MPDLLFFGASTSDKSDRSLEFHAETITQFMDHFEVPTFHLMGLSYGGFIGLKIANLWPDRVDKLIIVDCPGSLMEQKDHQQILDRFGVQDVHEIFIPKCPHDVQRLIKIAWKKPPFVPKFILRDVFRTLYRNQIPEKEGLLDCLLSYLDERKEPPTEIPQDTLVLWGEHDLVFPVELGVRLKNHIGDKAQMRVIEGCAHAPNQEKKKIFNQHVLSFLGS
jgi:pimeloyl-ACP methyl ester carboxylesterase